MTGYIPNNLLYPVTSETASEEHSIPEFDLIESGPKR